MSTPSVWTKSINNRLRRKQHLINVLKTVHTIFRTNYMPYSAFSTNSPLLSIFMHLHFSLDIRWRVYNISSRGSAPCYLSTWQKHNSSQSRDKEQCIFYPGIQLAHDLQIRLYYVKYSIYHKEYWVGILWLLCKEGIALIADFQ